MARGKAMKMESMMGGTDWVANIIAVVLIALGLWFVAGAFWSQSTLMRTFDWTTAIWYVIGVALLLYGKMWKHHGCECECH